MSWTIGSILDQTPLPRLEAELLLAHSLGLKRIKLFMDHQRVLTDEELIRFKNLLQRRGQHEPLAYITGSQPFMSLEFKVDRSVLIPRPETEELVEKIVELVNNDWRPETGDRRLVKIADIGTGCGCIAVCLAKFLPQAEVVGVDSSAEAIKIAEQNATKHGVTDRCQFIVGDLFDALSASKTQSLKGPQKFDIIVSNPPYIPTEDIEKLEEDVRIWEPKEALDGGQDGLDYIRKLINEAPNHLSTHQPNHPSTQPPKGYLILEFGLEQSAEIRGLAKDKFRSFEIKKDQQGKERFFIGS